VSKWVQISRTRIELMVCHTQQAGRRLGRLRQDHQHGWCELNNGRSVFVLPHTTKLPTDLPPGELAIFQSQHLHLQDGFAIEGSVADWCEQIAAPFASNSNVILAVSVALSGPLTVWAGVPPGLFHIFCDSKRGKSLISAIGQSIYGPR
jgi:uncharacterized protein (DUF927 family)